jgi:hypothetical protein
VSERAQPPGISASRSSRRHSSSSSSLSQSNSRLAQSGQNMLTFPSSSRYDRHRSSRSSQGRSQLPQVISNPNSAGAIISDIGRRGKWRWERLGQEPPSRPPAPPTAYPSRPLRNGSFTPSLRGAVAGRSPNASRPTATGCSFRPEPFANPPGRRRPEAPRPRRGLPGSGSHDGVATRTTKGREASERACRQLPASTLRADDHRCLARGG